MPMMSIYPLKPGRWPTRTCRATAAGGRHRQLRFTISVSVARRHRLTATSRRDDRPGIRPQPTPPACATWFHHLRRSVEEGSRAQPAELTVAVQHADGGGPEIVIGLFLDDQYRRPPPKYRQAGGTTRRPSSNNRPRAGRTNGRPPRPRAGATALRFRPRCRPSPAVAGHQQPQRHRSHDLDLFLCYSPSGCILIPLGLQTA